MPRQGVPYPSREICSLKCQIDALQRQINELMKSINGVQGDGQGNVSLISGDPAIVINSDQAQHEIEIALDSSQLPAAAVSSVNSQTGAVQLEADDIPSDGNSDVQADIDALKALGVNLQGAINNEVTARGNADSALQGNINTVQASIPGEAASAVANDPTVIQLATDVPNKLDKITSGSSLKAYTHTGATQGEKSVVDGVDADSIGIRDANGRMQAADPASGATDKTLTTANWISQTGSGAPNNLIHRSGNESRTGSLRMFGGYDLKVVRTSPAKWAKIATLSPLGVRHGYIFNVLVHSYNSANYADFKLHIQSYYGSDPANTTGCFNISGYNNTTANIPDKFKLCRNVTTGYWELYVETFTGATIEITLAENYNSTDIYYPNFITFEYTEVTEPVVDADITLIYTPTPTSVII